MTVKVVLDPNFSVVLSGRPQKKDHVTKMLLLESSDAIVWVGS